jgi:hypothetical protein
MTFEEVDTHVKGYKKATAPLKDKATAMAALCPVWKAAKPVITFFSGWLPATWKTVLTDLSLAMDLICP